MHTIVLTQSLARHTEVSGFVNNEHVRAPTV